MNLRLLPALALPLVAASLAPLHAEVRLPALFSDHAILQADVPAPVWGWADPGEAVKITFAGKTVQTKADANGRWIARLGPLPPSGNPQQLVVAGSNQLIVNDVIVGEVWLASGQSNMGFPLSASHNAAEAIPAAGDTQLRLFTVAKTTAAAPESDVKGSWQVCLPDTVKDFSAVAYFFGRDLRKALNRPVGLINAAWGGTPIQTWVSLDALKAAPPFTKYLDAWDKAVAEHAKVLADPALIPAYQADLKQWQTEVKPAFDAAMKAYNAAKAAGEDPGPKPKPERPEPSNPDPMAVPSPSARPSTPSVLFNSMISPLIPYGIRGVIWYQGEANGSGGLEYRTLFPRMIADWRTRWGLGNFSFLYVQLAGWDYAPTQPADQHDWPFLREAQLLTLSVPATGMAVITDVSNLKDVHPAAKSFVGERLALAARRVAYGEKLVASGPLFHDLKINGAKAQVNFTETGGGLVIGQAPWLAPKNDPLPTDRLVGFAIAGEDRRWFEAEATISGNSVILSSPDVPKPVAVRYGWANGPKANLANKEGLPASPFRTDDWPKGSAGPQVKTE